MRPAGTDSKTVGDGVRETGNATGQARRRPRASRVAGALAVAIPLVMLGVYIFSMYAGGMGHSMDSDTTAHQDAVASTIPAPLAGGQMVMPDGSVMDMNDHLGESAVTSATEADHVASPAPGAEHRMETGGAVNWYVVGGVLALIAALVAAVAGVKEHLARGIAMGTLGMERSLR